MTNTLLKIREKKEKEKKRKENYYLLLCITKELIWAHI